MSFQISQFLKPGEYLNGMLNMQLELTTSGDRRRVVDESSNLRSHQHVPTTMILALQTPWSY